MDGKDKVLLQLISELHAFCKEHGILYYLAEKEKTAWSASLLMDAENIRKFLSEFKCGSENRGLEWAGNNHAIIGDQIKYADLNTLYYTQERLVREKHLGMFVTIKPMNPSKSKLIKIDRYHKHLDFKASDKRSALLNAAAGRIHASRVAKSPGKLKKKDITEITIYDTPVYVRSDSAFVSAPEEAWDKLIVRKKNSDSFMCDETISYRELGLEEDRKILAKYERKLDRPKIMFKRGDALQNKCVQLSSASFCRFFAVTDLLQKYSYEEIEALGAEDGDVRNALDEYIGMATKLRSKKHSGYVGDRFTKVINKLYPEIDTDDLYAYTPDLYREGIKLYDYAGNLIDIYGGSDEH